MSGKTSTSSSPTSSKDSSPGKVEFFVGNRIEAMDYLCNWYASKIAKVDHKKKKILIHFEGWNQRYDEWVSFDSKKIRALPKEKAVSKSKTKEYKEWKDGEIVSARWTDGTYYPAKIVKVISKDFYEVEYDDGFQKLIHQSKIREHDATNKLKKPSSSKRTTQPLRKAKLAHDRASRARRRSVKDTSLLSPSEYTQHMEESKEIEGKEDEIEKKEVEAEKYEVKCKDMTSRKRQRHDSDVSQESKRHKIDLTAENEPKHDDLRSTSLPTDKPSQPLHKTEAIVSPVSQSDETKTSKTTELQSEATPKVAEKLNKPSKTIELQSETTPLKMAEKSKTSLPDEVSVTENMIRVTHIKEHVKSVSSKTESDKRSITSPLTVEVDPRTDIRQVIIPDKDMNILQSTGVLGLLNVREPCVILGTTLAGSSVTTSAADEVLSKCKIPGRVTTELKVSETNVVHVGRKEKTDEGKILEEIYILEKAELSRKKQGDIRRAKAETGSRGTIVDRRSSGDTSRDTQQAEVDEPSGLKQDIESDMGKDKDMKSLEKSDVNPGSVPQHLEEVCLDKDKSLTSPEQEYIDSSKARDEADREEATEHAQKSEEATEHAGKSEEASKTKPQVLGAGSFKAKRLRLDQITGKLSIQRQTQITAKREVIKQKIDHLTSEEITKSIYVPPSYQQISPNPPPYPRVSAPTTRIPPQYVERYPAPTLLAYGAPTQCTGPCCTYPPVSSYTPGGTGGYHLSPGGLPRETYVVYGPGTQASFPVIAPNISPAPCSCCSLYPTAVLHESGQSPALVRLMQVEQRMPSLPASLVYTHTTSHPSHSGERPKISPRGLSPRGISPKGISPEGRKPGRAHMSKKAEVESGAKHKDCGKASIEGKHGIRSEESTSKKAIQTSSKLSKDVKSGQFKPSDKSSSDGLKPSHTHIHSHTSHIHPHTSQIHPHTPTKVNPKASHGIPTNPSTTPNARDVNLSKHLSAHLTSPDTPPNNAPTKRPPPSHLSLDPDDIPLSRLVGASTPGDAKTPWGAITPEVVTPITPCGDSPMDQLMSTPLPTDGHPGKMLRRQHVFAPKELRIELDHNKYKCEYADCDKSFRKASLLESHVKYYHTSRLDNKRKRSSASGSEEDWYETAYPKRRTKRQSTSDVSIGSVGDISVDAQSPTASDIHVEIEHDLDDEMEVDISEHKEEDVVRCLCGAREDSGLMIQCEQCYTWQHSDCVHVGEGHVPTKYLCYVCRNPPGLRKNAKYKNNYDWFKTGILPSFVAHEEHEVKIVQSQVTHCLLADLHTLNSELKGLKRKVHILRFSNGEQLGMGLFRSALLQETPDHADLKMWEHKHEVCEDDSLTTTEGDSSRNDSSVSEKESGMNEENISEGKSLEEGPSEDVPRDERNTRVGDPTRVGDHTRVVDHTRGTRTTRENDVTDARNGKSADGKDRSENKSVSNEGTTVSRGERNSQGDRVGQVTEPSLVSEQGNGLSEQTASVNEASNELPHEGKNQLNNGQVEISEQSNQESARLSIDKAREEKQTTRVSDNLARGVKETSRFNDKQSGDENDSGGSTRLHNIQARSGQESARVNDIQARNVIESARVNDIQTRDGKDSARMNDTQARSGQESARLNDIQARGAEQTRNAQQSSRSKDGSMGSVDNNQEGCNNLRENETGTVSGRFDEAKMKYSGEDLAYVNLLEEIEDDQTFFDEQLDRLEKQVEILEKSLLTGTTERRPSVRKLAKQLSKLQKLGFVC